MKYMAWVLTDAGFGNTCTVTAFIFYYIKHYKFYYYIIYVDMLMYYVNIIFINNYKIVGESIIINWELDPIESFTLSVKIYQCYIERL